MKAKIFHKSWVSILLAVACSVYSLPPMTVLGVSELTDLAHGLAYETNWQDSEFNGGHDDTDHKKLTDDATTTSIWSGDSVHFRKRDSGEPVILTFDLEQECNLYRMEIVGIHEGAAGVSRPSHYQIDYYDEEIGDWVFAYEEVPDTVADGSFTYRAEFDSAPVCTGQVRLTITPESDSRATFLCLTDIRIFGEVASPGTIAQKPAISQNLPETKLVSMQEKFTLSVEAAVTDGGTLSYQWYKDGTCIGNDSSEYSVTAASLSDSGSYSVKVTNTLGDKTAAIDSNICIVTVIDPDAPAQIPVIRRDLEPSVSVSAGEPISFEIEAETPDYGTLSYQWYIDDDPVGNNSPRYTIPSAALSDSGTYSVKVTNTKGGVSETVESVSCLLTVRKKLPNLLGGMTYTTSLSQQDYHSSWPDFDHVKLTDGIKSSIWNQSDSVGFYTFGATPSFSLEFDLNLPISLRQINLGIFQDVASGIQYPASIKVEFKNEECSDWLTLYEGMPINAKDGRTETVLTSDESLTADDLRFTIRGSGAWVFLDEIEVFDETTGARPDGKLSVQELPPVPAGRNLALGKLYEVSQPTDTYPDTGHKELTDGVLGSLSYSDPAWVGFNFWHEKGKEPVEIVVDLEEIQTIGEVRMNLLQSDGGISFPKEINIYTSKDSYAWNQLCGGAETFDVIIDLGEIQSFERVKAGFLKDEAAPPNQDIFRFVYSIPHTVEARYVKVQMVYDSWVFIDEIQVMDRADDREVPTPQQSPQDEIEPDLNNIAFGCSYETQWNYSDLLPDSVRGKLTDGRRGSPNCQSKEWTAYSSIEGIGGYQSYKAFSSQFPDYIKVEYSDDKIKWKTLTERDLSSLQNSSNGIYRFDYAQEAVSGRYVKFTMNMSQLLAMDEIEILKVDDGSPDAEMDPDKGRSLNLISGYDVELSRSADAGNNGNLLTDGIQGIDDGQCLQFQYYNGYPLDNHIVLDVDITSFNSVSDILLTAKAGNALPQNLVFKVSTDKKEWISLKEFGDGSEAVLNGTTAAFCWRGESDSFYSSVEGAVKAYTRYIRIEFDIPRGKTVSLSELEVIGKRGKCSDAGLVMEPRGEIYNVALGKPYTITPAGKENRFPDTGGLELTDGIRGTASIADPAWVGFKAVDIASGKQVDRWPLKTIVIDLEEVKSISSIRFNMLSSSSIQSNQPWVVRTFASMDSKKWTQLSQNNTINIWPGELDSYGWHFDDTNGESRDLTGGAETVAARYIRVDIELVNWNLIDEIEVMGSDGQKEGDLIADNGRYFENGREYLVPGEETTKGVGDMVLCYNGWYGLDSESQNPVGDWAPHMYKPFLTYVDQDGRSVDTMFDTVLLLGLVSQYGRAFDPAGAISDPQLEDWFWYLEKNFKPGGDVENLNTAAKQASIDLNRPDYKVKLVFMIPTIPETITYFGTLNGKPLNLTKEEDRHTLLNWYLDLVLKEMEKYEYIDFVGFYWLSEDGAYTPTAIRYASDCVHERGCYLYWIPYFFGSGNLWGDQLGFDAVAIQPNHYFGSPYDLTGDGRFGTERVVNAAKMASYGVTGIEMEVDERIIDDLGKYNQFLDYLNAGIDRGFGGPNVYRAWYQGIRAMAQFAYADEQEVRDIYDYSYQFLKGTLTEPISYLEDFTHEPVGGSSGEVSGSKKQSFIPGVDQPDPETSSCDFAWEETADGWKYKQADGSYAAGWLKLQNTWYYLGDDGLMKVGWLNEDGIWYYLQGWGGMANTQWVKAGNDWYYFRGNGAMFTGWLLQGDTWYYLKPSGNMATGWNWIGSKCYYFDQNGKMASDTTVGGYKVDASGAWVK